MKSTCYNTLSLLFFILLIALFGGCEKEDYTLPVEFRLDFTIKNEPILDGSITIDEIALSLNSIDISGYREQGGDVFSTRRFDQGKFFEIKPTSRNATEKFDIPHGIYNPISFSYNFQPDNEEDDLIEDISEWHEDLEEEDDDMEDDDQEEDDDLEDLQEDLGDIIEDYLEDIHPCIFVKGKFTHNQKTKHIVLVVNDPLTFEIPGKNKEGGSEVVLDKEQVNTGNLQLNPSYWFSVITPKMLNDAFIGVIDDEAYILLSKHVNSQIYTSVVFNRIEDSTILTINE